MFESEKIRFYFRLQLPKKLGCVTRNNIIIVSKTKIGKTISLVTKRKCEFLFIVCSIGSLGSVDFPISPACSDSFFDQLSNKDFRSNKEDVERKHIKFAWFWQLLTCPPWFIPLFDALQYFCFETIGLCMFAVCLVPLILTVWMEHPEKWVEMRIFSFLIQSHRFASLHFCGYTFPWDVQTGKILALVLQMRS